MSGVLFIVSTPIGNLRDITFRAIDTLKEADIIACEDTRVTRKLLMRYEIPTKPLYSYREHNERRMSGRLLALLKEGKNIALVADAGTPTISDPGAIIVKRANEEGIRVVPIPGPSAAIAALSISGFSSGGFLFLGFPPRKSGRQKKLFESVKNYPYAIVFYESPFRIIKTLKAMKEIFGPDRKIVICRELTKIFEETIRDTISKIISELESRKVIKGEFVIVVEGI